MVRDVKISSFQLSMLIIGFIFGSSAILNPSVGAGQDAWLAYLLGLSGGLLLMGIYVLIARLNPEKTLIEILRTSFGKYIGSIIAVFYIWYFIHLAVLVLRNFSEYMSISVYAETPIIFIIISYALVIAYLVKSGLEVMGRLGEIMVPLLPLMVFFLFLSLIPVYDISNFSPFLGQGIKPVLKTAFSIVTFPFGETVLFLMIFPYLNKKENIFKTAYLSILIAGLILINITVRDLMVLGPDMLFRTVFPPAISTKLIPFGNLDPLIAVNLLIGGGAKISICLYAAVTGITQLLNLKNYKLFVLPALTIIVTLSIWIYDNVLQMIYWAADIYPYYAIPFQVIIPVIILVISLIRKAEE